MKKRLFVVTMISAMTISMVACGNKEMEGSEVTMGDIVVDIPEATEEPETEVTIEPEVKDAEEILEVEATPEPTEVPGVIATLVPTEVPAATATPELTAELVAESDSDDGWISFDELLERHGWVEEDLTEEQLGILHIEESYLNLDITIKESKAKGLKETDAGYYGGVDYGHDPYLEKFYGCNIEEEFYRLCELSNTDESADDDVCILMPAYIGGFSSIEDYERYRRITGDDGCIDVQYYWQLKNEGVIKD